MPGKSLIGNLAVNLLMETFAFEKGATYAEKRANQMERKFRSIGQGLESLGRSMTLSLTAPILGAGVAVVKMTGDFEGAMNRVSISTKASAGEMKEMSDLALQLGKDTVFGATSSADAMDMLAKNGLSARQILDGAATAAVNLASAAGSDLEPAANAITDVMQQFKLTTADLPKAVNQITGAVNESKLSFEDYALAIGQAGGVAGAAGVDFDDFNAAIAGTSALFASGSDAGTSFKTFLVALTPTTKKAAQIVQEFGLQFFDAQGNMRSMAEIAEELKTKLGGLSEEARTNTLKELFGTDAMRTAIGLMDQGAAGINKIKAAIAGTDAAAQSEQRLKGFNGQLEQLKGAIETLAIKVGQSGILEAVTGMVIGLSNFVDRLSELSPEVLQFGTVLAAIAAAAGPVIVVLGNLVTLFAPLAAAAGGFGAAFAVALPVIAAVAAAGALIYANWDKIGPVLEDLWKQMQTTLGPPLMDLINSVGALLSDLWNSAFGTGLRMAASALLDLYLAWNKTIGPVFIQALGFVIQRIADVVKAIGDMVRMTTALLTGDWKAAWQAMRAMFEHLFGGLPSYVEGVMRNMVTAVKTWVVDKLSGIWDTVKAKIDAVKGWFFGLYDAVVGHSYVPDMVDEIAAQMLRLDDVMVKKAKTTAEQTKAHFQKLRDDLAPLLERLFPEAAALNKLRADRAVLDQGEKTGAITAGQRSEAERRLALEGRDSGFEKTAADWNTPFAAMPNIQDQLMKLVSGTRETAGGVEAANVRIVTSFKDMAEDTLSALQNLSNSIKGGGILDIFSSVVNLLLQIGSIGGFGKTIAKNINTGSFGGFRANGGPVVPGKSYIVGERGPEWFTPGSGGAIAPMNDNGGGSTVHVVPSPYFEVVVDQRASRVAAPMAVASGQVARAGAQSDIQRRMRRRIPG